MKPSDKQTTLQSMHALPLTEGPIPVTPQSHPFSTMAFSRCRLNLEDYDFLEEEYFLSGRANVYTEDEDDRPKVVSAGLPYKNRILVRRPRDPAKFSGRVFIDILNASNGYDIEDLWRRAYLYCLENGHAYIGVTSKPINVMSLKWFDPARYRSLNWAGAVPAPQPAVPVNPSVVPGCEEGLLWDILSQTGALVRRDPSRILGDCKPEWVYLTGQSQSGVSLNTYVHHFHPFTADGERKRLFDGYLNIVGVVARRTLCQQDDDSHLFPMVVGKPCPVSTPFICITAEGDLNTFGNGIGSQAFRNARPDNSDGPAGLLCYYEVAGPPHTDDACPVVPSDEEAAKTKTPIVFPKKKSDYLPDDMPLAWYVCGAMENLHRWAKEGAAPPKAPLLELGEGLECRRDEHGNALGGVRSPFLDVPAAAYYGCTHSDLPRGIRIPFSPEKMKALYGSFDRYLALFADYAARQVAQGWLMPRDADRMVEQAKQYRF